MTRLNTLPPITVDEMNNNITIAKALLQEQPTISFGNYWKELYETEGFTETLAGGEPRGDDEAENFEGICDLYFNKPKGI